MSCSWNSNERPGRRDRVYDLHMAFLAHCVVFTCKDKGRNLDDGIPFLTRPMLEDSANCELALTLHSNINLFVEIGTFSMIVSFEIGYLSFGEMTSKNFVHLFIRWMVIGFGVFKFTKQLLRESW
jgi:hypothetical protein